MRESIYARENKYFSQKCVGLSCGGKGVTVVVITCSLNIMELSPAEEKGGADKGTSTLDTGCTSRGPLVDGPHRRWGALPVSRQCHMEDGELCKLAWCIVGTPGAS